MDIFIAICCDRHINEVVRVFTTPEAAIAYAKHFSRQKARSHKEIKEEDITGWLYYACYSSEGDSVRVEKGVLDNEDEPPELQQAGREGG